MLHISVTIYLIFISLEAGLLWFFFYEKKITISWAESLKDINNNTVQRSSVENQKDTIAKDFVQGKHPSGSQRTIFKQLL